MEYLDGVLVERGMPTIAHSLLQMILIQYFGRYQKLGRFLPLPEVRTQIIERGSLSNPLRDAMPRTPSQRQSSDLSPLGYHRSRVP